MVQRFSKLLRDLVGDERGARTAFAEQVGVTMSFVNSVMVGRRRPPSKTEDLSAWADALSLTGRQRDDFILAGLLERTPEEIRTMIYELRSEIEELESRVSELERRRGRVAEDPDSSS